MRKISTYRVFFILLFLSAYSLSLFKSYLPYAYYYLNYTYIANNLCENKAKPAMHCNGKCHLARIIKKTGQENSSAKSQAASLLKLLSLQEMPSTDFRLALKDASPAALKNKTDVNEYASPVIKISAPPPRAEGYSRA